MDIREKISGIEGVSANGTATINLPVNRRYKGIKLFATGEDGSSNPLPAEDIIDGIQIIVGSVTMLDLTATQLRAIYDLNLSAPFAAVSIPNDEIPIPFAEPWRASVTDETVTSYDTFGVAAFTMKVKIKSGVVNPAIAGVATFDYLRSTLGDKVVLQPIKKYAVTINASGGNYDITQIMARNPVQRILLDGAQTINAVEVYADSTRVYESTTAQNARFLADYGIDAAFFGFPIVFDCTQQLFAGALTVRKDLVIRVNSAAAQTITAIVEERMSRYE